MPCGLNEFEALRFHENRHKKVLRLSALLSMAAFTPRRYSWYLFLLETELIPGT